MNIIRLGAVLVTFIVIAVIALAVRNSGNPFEPVVIENGLSAFKEEVCVEGFDKITCTEKTYVKCNEGIYNIPVPTALTVRDEVYTKEYIEKDCSAEASIAEKYSGKEVPSPKDRIKDSDIEVSNSRTTINIKNLRWRKFIDSNSMDPFIDEGTTTIEIVPKKEGDIVVGDIIAFNLEGYEYAVVHRVVQIGNDGKEAFFVTKGDNFYKEDPEKVRFSQIEGIVVGILY